MRIQHILVIILALFHVGTGPALAETNTLFLEDFLKLVQTQSLDIQVEKSINDESQAKAQGTRIPPPMIGVMNMKDSGGVNRGIEISQELPFPTKIFKEKDVRELEAQAQNTNFRYRKNEILLEARQSYFEYWKVYETKEIIEEKRTWLSSHLKLSRSLTRSDTSAQIHLLAIESEVDQLENELLEMQSELSEKRNQLKSIAPGLVSQNFSPESQPKIEDINIEKKMDSGLLIESKRVALDAAIADANLKKQAYLPDFTLRYRSYQGNEMNPRNEELMLGISLPFLFFSQPHAEVAEASAKQQRAEVELQKEKLRIENQLDSQIERLKNMKTQYINMSQKLIPRANQRMKLVESLTVRSMEGLDEHRMVMLDYLELKQKEINLRFEIEKLSLEILKLVSQ